MFEDLKLHWGDRAYVLPAGRRLKAIAAVEQHVTRAQLGQWSKRNTAGEQVLAVEVAPLSYAVAAALRFAGAAVPPEEVYAALDGEKDQPSQLMLALELVYLVMAVMQPSQQDEMSEHAEEMRGNRQRRATEMAASSSANSTSPSSSAESGSPETSSGGRTRRSSSGSSKRTRASTAG